MPISKNKHIFKTPAATQAWAKRFAAGLKPGDVVALIGPLGAGKTTFVQGLARGWKARGAISSPTFALVNEYPSPRGPMYHMDMYRLSPREIKFFPLEDYLGAGLCVIEWADRIAARLPAQTKVLRLSVPALPAGRPDPGTRALTLGAL